MAESPTVAEISIGAAPACDTAKQPGAIAVQCEDRALTWESLHRRTNRVARILERRGLKQGDFLTIALPNAELDASVELAQTPFVIADAATNAIIHRQRVVGAALSGQHDTHFPNNIAAAETMAADHVNEYVPTESDFQDD